MLEGPLAVVIGESVTGDVANVVEDHRGILARRWPEHATDLLQV